MALSLCLPARVRARSLTMSLAYKRMRRACAKARSLGCLRQNRSARQPAVDEVIEPGAFGGIVDGTIREMMMPLPRAGRAEAVIAARGPAMHHGVGHVRMELHAESVAGAERLHRKIIAFRKQFSADRQLETFAMPVIDPRRPIRAEPVSRFCRADRVVADLGQRIGMRRDASS